MFSTICLLMIAPQNRQLDGMRKMIAGFSSLLLATTFVLAGKHLPVFFPYVAGNVLLLVGLALLHFSFPEAKNRSGWQLSFSALMFVLLFAGTAYFTYVHDAHAWRVFFVSLTLSAESWMTAFVLFRYAEPDAQYPARCTAVMFALQGGVQAARMVWILIYRMAPDEVNTSMRWLVVLAYAVIAATIPLLYFWKNMVRLQGLLERQAVTDPLTGLLNRRGLEEVVAIELARLMRKPETSPFSVVTFDLDHFKQLNDRHGHAAGDHVLYSLSSALRSQLRTVDRLARTGGEEFLILLPETCTVEALAIAERTRAFIESLTIPIEKDVLTVTASFGVATVLSEFEDWASITSRADASLYSAKRSGRNCVADTQGLVTRIAEFV